MKYKKDIDNLPCGYAIIQFAGNFPILSANKNFYRLLEMDPNTYDHDLIRSKFIKLIFKEDYKALLPYINKKVQQGQDKILFDFRIAIRNNKIRYLLVNATKIKSKQGDFIYQCVFIDITEKQEHKLLLYRKQKEFNSMIANIPGAVIDYEFGENLKLTMCSESYFKISGFTSKELKDLFHNQHQKLIHPDDLMDAKIRAEQQLSEKDGFEIEYRYLHKKGNYICLLERGHKYQYLNKTYIISILINISDLNLQRNQTDLLQNRFSTILEQTQDIIYEWDIQTGAVYHSDNFRKRYGYSPPTHSCTKSIIFSRLGFYPNTKEIVSNQFGVHPEDIPIVTQCTREALNGKKYLEFIYRIRSIDGVYHWARNKMTTIYDSNNQPMKIIGMIIDIDSEHKQQQIKKNREKMEKEVIITKTKLLEQQLENQLAYYERVEQMQNEFKSYRHDLNNHFLCLKSLLDNDNFDQAQDYLEQITSTYNQYEDMVSTGNPILDAILYEKIKVALQYNIHIEKHINIVRNIPIRSVDWCILIGNSLDNAIEACQKIDEPEQRSICITMISKGNSLSIKITNSTNGQAIKDGDLFITTKHNSEHHGIGLKNMKAVVDAYNGVLELKHENNTFTTITLLCFE